MIEGDRTGQLWKLVGSIGLVVGPPTRRFTQNQMERFEVLIHPCVLLTMSSPRVAGLAERVSNPWDDRLLLRRIL